MATGPGKFDAECTIAREATDAAGAILIVIDGTLGSGFSVQVIDPEIARRMPIILRTVADQIEADMEGI